MQEFHALTQATDKHRVRFNIKFCKRWRAFDFEDDSSYAQKFIVEKSDLRLMRSIKEKAIPDEAYKSSSSAQTWWWLCQTKMLCMLGYLGWDIFIVNDWMRKAEATFRKFSK
jgi:hypothetical protein